MFASARCLIARTRRGSPEGNLRHLPRQSYRDFVLTDPADPFIPGTEIPRLRPIHLGGKSVGVERRRNPARRRWRCSIFTPAKPLSVPVPTRRPRHTATSGRPTSARRPMSECLAQRRRLNRFAVPEAIPASVDNRTVGKNYGRCPSALAKGSGRPAGTEGNSHGAFIPHIRGCRQVVSISISSAWTSPAHYGIQPRKRGPAAFHQSDRSWRKPGRTSAPKTDRRRDLLLARRRRAIPTRSVWL